MQKTKILALDCSTDCISLSVCGHNSTLQGGAKASGHLLAAIQTLLQAQNLHVHTLDAIAYGRGPGAFTGLRTALAVAQGLAFAVHLPLIAVDGLQALAFAAHVCTGARYIVAALDARMGEVYSAQYDWELQQQTAYQNPASVQLLPAAALQVPSGFLLTGNCAGQSERPQASAIAQIAAVLFQAGATLAPSQASLHYVRDKVALTTHERHLAKHLHSQRPHA